jgi:hypothetical protein
MQSWDKARKEPVYGPSGDRRKGGASPDQAFVWNVGTERLDVKGEVRGDEPRRASVPMRDDGADWSVVVMKPGNAGGAKGPACPASSMRQPNKWGGASA